MLTLHHQPDKRERYDARRPYYFDEDLDVVCILDAELIGAIFKSRDFSTTPFADHYRAIEKRTGIDFAASISTLDHVPFSKEAEEHQRLRIAVATVVSAESREHIAGMEAFVDDLVRELFIAGNEIELVQQLARPIFYELFSRWLKVDQREFLKESNISQVFDGAMSLNRRKKVNRNLHEAICSFAKRRDQMPVTPELAAAMNVLGNDALIGSMVLSIWYMLEQHPGARLSDIEFPPNLPATSVPFIERIANKDVEIGGLKVAKDQKVRLIIDATARQVTGEEADLFFGKGRHLCLGKPMTLTIWRSLAKAFGAVPLRFSLYEMQLRSGDYAFTYPEHARLQIHD
jgi:cytochrome P450